MTSNVSGLSPSYLKFEQYAATRTILANDFAEMVEPLRPWRQDSRQRDKRELKIETKTELNVHRASIIISVLLLSPSSHSFFFSFLSFGSIFF